MPIIEPARNLRFAAGIVKSSSPAYGRAMNEINTNLKNVLGKIGAAAEKAGRQTPTLVAVSKTHPAEAVREALLAGQRVFGENRVQEAAAKFPELKRDYPDLQLHLIGPLQTNKVAEAVALFDVIQTLDRPKLAQVLAEEMKRQNRFPRLYIEVNLGREPQKAGLMPEDVPAFLDQCRDEFHIEIHGVMCIPPFDQDPKPFFQELKRMGNDLGLPALSMGMSADYEAAIACGATEVRVGTAVFGSRL